MDKKKLLIGTLCALIMIMAVGYALLAQQLSITGSASITSNWQVEVTNITEKEKSTGAKTNSTNYTATTATFNTSLTTPGDYAIYEVTITNKGTLDAVLADIRITNTDNNAIIYEKKGLKIGDKLLKNNGTNTLEIKVQYNPNTTTQPSNITSTTELSLNYEQDLGQTLYDYKRGDVISFAGSYWYTLKSSPVDQDYIVLLKRDTLDKSEIPIEYQYRSRNSNGKYPQNSSVPYYWSDTCHGHNGHSFGTNIYSNEDYSGCSGHNDYEGSKIKEMLENTYLPTIDPNEKSLKEVDGYKIRLITFSEVVDDFGYELKPYSGYRAPSGTPGWIMGNGYWTMTPYDDRYNYAYYVWFVVGDTLTTSRVTIGSQNNATMYVRPVINLLKSAIE